MKALDTLNILNDLSASQRGLFTSAQARSMGVDKLSLSRLESRGHIERMMHGIYRSCAAPSFREEEVWAAWLALDPTTPAWERLRNGTRAVASHGTAAWLLELGELNPTPITFTLPKRKQTRRQGLRLLKGSVSEHELTTIAGIPTTTPAKTVLDLLDDTEDPSLVANVLRDAARTDEKVLGDEFVAKVDSRGKRYGIPRGESLYSRLMEG